MSLLSTSIKATKIRSPIKRKDKNIILYALDAILSILIVLLSCFKYKYFTLKYGQYKFFEISKLFLFLVREKGSKLFANSDPRQLPR